MAIYFEFHFFSLQKLTKWETGLLLDLVMADLVKTRQRNLNKGNKVWTEATLFDDEKVSIQYVFLLI